MAKAMKPEPNAIAAALSAPESILNFVPRPPPPADSPSASASGRETKSEPCRLISSVAFDCCAWTVTKEQHRPCMRTNHQSDWRPRRAQAAARAPPLLPTRTAAREMAFSTPVAASAKRTKHREACQTILPMLTCRCTRRTVSVCGSFTCIRRDRARVLLSITRPALPRAG
jgi:hypothetical protein